jgi:hypothetical protein
LQATSEQLAPLDGLRFNGSFEKVWRFNDSMIQMLVFLSSPGGEQGTAPALDLGNVGSDISISVGVPSVTVMVSEAGPSPRHSSTARDESSTNLGRYDWKI